MLAFFHIEGWLIIKFEVTITAHQTQYFYNTFCISISFSQYLNILYPHQIKESRIVLRYLWVNHYYQVEEEEIIYTPSRVSLAIGVTVSDKSTYANTPSLPSTPEILPQVELPILPNHFTSGLWVPTELASQSRLIDITQSYLEWVESCWNQPPFAADLILDQVLAQIRSGINLDQPAFREGNITYHNLWNIDRNANPTILYWIVWHSWQ